MSHGTCCLSYQIRLIDSEPTATLLIHRRSDILQHATGRALPDARIAFCVLPACQLACRRPRTPFKQAGPRWLRSSRRCHHVQIVPNLVQDYNIIAFIFSVCACVWVPPITRWVERRASHLPISCLPRRIAVAIRRPARSTSSRKEEGKSCGTGYIRISSSAFPLWTYSLWLLR